MLGVEIWEEFRVWPWDDWLGWWWGRLGSTTGVGCGRGEKTPVAIVGGFAGLSGCCSLIEPFHMWKLGWTDGCTTTGLFERMASATEMLTNGLENSWKLELGDVSTCTGNDDGGMEKACPGTTTGISGLTDSPSDEKFETLRAIPFLSCFLKKKKFDVRIDSRYGPGLHTVGCSDLRNNPNARTNPTGGLRYISRDTTFCYYWPFEAITRKPSLRAFSVILDVSACLPPNSNTTNESWNLAI